MKKLIGIFVILFIATGVFGQKFIRDFSFIEATPTANNTIEDALHEDGATDGDFDWINYVHFVRNDKLYLLAYEPNENHVFGVDRSVYMYAKDLTNIDSPWEQVSESILTSGWTDSWNYGEVDFFLKDKSAGSKGEVFVDGDKVYITIGLEVMANGNVSIDKPITFGFVLQKNGFYHNFVSYKQTSDDKSSSIQ